MDIEFYTIVVAMRNEAIKAINPDDFLTTDCWFDSTSYDAAVNMKTLELAYKAIEEKLVNDEYAPRRREALRYAMKK